MAHVLSPIEEHAEDTGDEVDRVLTLRVAEVLYQAVVSEAKAARHSINSAGNILLEEALVARGKFSPPSEARTPFWLRGAKKESTK